MSNVSINVRGAIKNFEQRNKLLSCVAINNINILLLQETHVSNLGIKPEIDRLFDCQSFWSFGSNDSRGVAVLLMNNFEREIINFKKDREGRIISLIIKSELGELNIVSV